MNTEEFEWKGYKWITKERWGDIHPDKPWARYSNECVNIDKKGNLVLDIMYNDTDKIFDMGLVSSHQDNPRFGFGYYEWVAKLPKGKHLWPALWMWSFDRWPPELDVMEAWSNERGTYLMSDNKTLCITNCYHYDEADDHIAGFLRLKDCWYCLPQCAFNSYAMDWTSDHLKFYFNNKCIRTIDDKDQLNWISENSKSGMNVIMNLYPTESFKQGELKSKLIIKDFMYIPQ